MLRVGELSKCCWSNKRLGAISRQLLSNESYLRSDRVVQSAIQKSKNEDTRESFLELTILNHPTT